MRVFPSTLASLGLIGVAATLATPASADIAASQQPLAAGSSAPPLMMLVMQRDHKLYYEAYNDASDLDGDGVPDTGFKPSMVYLGYFDSNLCYEYKSSRFEPKLKATSMKCDGSTWAGNWLNYMTTSRMDALRRVLYGGMRYSDTATETVLQRSYIPQDAHSWGKEYNSEAVDGYKISDFTPLSAPSSGTRHMFANVTVVNTTTPLLRVRVNSTDHFYNWVSKESPVADTTCATGGNSTHNCTGTLTDYTVRVKVCASATLLDDVCTRYPSGDYKPTGLLQKYGAGGSMKFGLLTGSYSKNLSGGVLRKNIGTLTDEINTSTGQFLLTGDNDQGVINTINRFSITGFNSSRQYTCGWITTRAPTSGECSMWGNPIGEMMYETVRYFAGATATSNFSTAVNAGEENTLKLPVASWKNPYQSVADGGLGADVCAKPFMMVISDINPSYDSDELPGSSFLATGFSGSLGSYSTGGSSLNVSTEADRIWSSEGLSAGSYFIGQSGSTTDNAPTAKNVTGFSTIRGLSPEEPTKQGSYYSAAVAEWARTNQVNSLSVSSKVKTFSVVMASPLPRITIPVGEKSVTIIPFAKSVGGSSISASSGQFQPTDQLVDYYITSIKNTSTANTDATVNGGRPYYEFMINYEDVEQGADHDMDAIAKYTVSKNANGTITVNVESTYAAGGIIQHMGYVVSGSTSDGTYLVVRDYDTSSGDPNYYLDYPSHPSSMLPLTSTLTFTAGASSASFIPHDPLWYAAKWGGYKDSDVSTALTTTAQWDSDGDGTPDNYYLVTNPAKLYEQLDAAFSNAASSAASASALAANSTQLNTDTLLYAASYRAANWTGEVTAYSVNTDGSAGDVKWTASTQIPAAASRKVFSWKLVAPSSGAYTATGITFAYASLSAAQLTNLGQAPAFSGTVTQDNQTNLINYIKGDQSNEGTNYRSRTGLLGDIVNSSPVYGGFVDFGYDVLPATAGGNSYLKYLNDKRTGTQTLYFGANDGMLHAVNAKTGAELFTYVPDAVIKNLRYLASTSYSSSHRYFVDGPLTYADAYIGSAWKSYLVGTTGEGGKSVFALDVTNASSFSTSNVRWEFTNTELGYTISKPVVAKMANGRWAVITGNGPESTSGTAKLFVIYLDATLNDTTGWTASQDYCVISTDSAGSSGLGSPTVTLNSQGVAQYIYAGDLLGKMWRFNVGGDAANPPSEACPSGWTANKVFTATNASGTAQPITAAPDIEAGATSGYTVLFGTGRFYLSTDPADKTIQTMYGVQDSLADNPRVTRADLVEQKFLKQTTGTQTNSDTSDTYSYDLRTSSAYTVDFTQKKGWYIDLVGVSSSGTAVATGERVISTPSVYNNSVVMFVSYVPSADVCTAGGTSYLNALNYLTGARTSVSFFDTDHNGSFDASDSFGTGHSDIASSIKIKGNGTEVISLTSGNTRKTNTGGSNGDPEHGPDSPKSRVMASWRQIK